MSDHRPKFDETDEAFAVRRKEERQGSPWKRVGDLPESKPARPPTPSKGAEIAARETRADFVEAQFIDGDGTEVLETYDSLHLRLPGCTINKKTAKAIGVYHPELDRTTFIPLSQLHDDSDVEMGPANVIFKSWLAYRRGWLPKGYTP